MKTGTITKILERNFGFISCVGKEYFFHRSDFIGFWEDLLNDYHRDKNIQVTFDAMDTPKGPRAANVKRTDFPN